MEPCGTPHNRGALEEEDQLLMTENVLSDRKSLQCSATDTKKVV